jgi:hypothetical protein
LENQHSSETHLKPIINTPETVVVETPEESVERKTESQMRFSVPKVVVVMIFLSQYVLIRMMYLVVVPQMDSLTSVKYFCDRSVNFSGYSSLFHQ